MMETSLLMRMSILVVLVLTFGISGYYRSRARQEGGKIKRQEEGWWAVIVRLGFALPLLAVMLLNIFFPSTLTWTKFNLPFGLRIFGLILSFLCFPFLWWVFRSIGKNISETVLIKDEHQLVTQGPYRFIRHPLYAGALLLLISTSLVFGDYIILGYALAGILAFRLLIIPVEEEQLLEAFGEDYECYQSRTGALLPWIR